MSPLLRTFVVAGAMLAGAGRAAAAGHGPVFGFATPTLGRGGWSLDEAWTCRAGDNQERPQMLKTMLSFGVTENLQLSGSIPLAATEGLGAARMMSAMSSDREVEVLAAYRFQRRVVGIGGRQESTVAVGATGPLERQRNGIAAGPSIEASIATGYASRAHYVWVGGGAQHYLDRSSDRLGESLLLTAVYGYRPPPLRTEAGRPDLRFFIEATAEDRASDRVAGMEVGNASRSVFVGPTALLLHKAVGVEGGVLFPAYQRVEGGTSTEHFRVAVDVSYFFWLR